jgi:hypothetical protein
MNTFELQIRVMATFSLMAVVASVIPNFSKVGAIFAALLQIMIFGMPVWAAICWMDTFVVLYALELKMIHFANGIFDFPTMTSIKAIWLRRVVLPQFAMRMSNTITMRVNNSIVRHLNGIHSRKLILVAQTMKITPKPRVTYGALQHKLYDVMASLPRDGARAVDEDAVNIVCDAVETAIQILDFADSNPRHFVNEKRMA